MGKVDDMRAWNEWREYYRALKRDKAVDSLSPVERKQRLAKLEKDPVAWMLFFFAEYARYPFTSFQKKAIRRITSNSEWYEVLSWSRELAKSTIVFMCIMFLVLTKRKRNVLLVSNSHENATRLLEPYKKAFEHNALLKAYYGDLREAGNWTADEFSLTSGAAFRALGALESPRGTRKDAFRPDTILPDDFDTDADCRNPDIVKKKWQWFEVGADSDPIGKRRPAGRFLRERHRPGLLRNAGRRQGRPLGHREHPRQNGFSTWPEKNSEEDIDRTLSKISKKAAQGEYFNNPISVGEVFENIAYGKVPALSKFKFLVVYGDPAPGESKGKKGKSFKTVSLCGKLGGRLYVIKTFLAQALNAEFIDWYVRMLEFVGARPMSIATWRTTSCRTLSSNRCSNRWWQKYAANRRLRCSSGATRRRRRTRLRASRPTLNRSTARGTSSSTRLNGTIRT